MKTNRKEMFLLVLAAVISSSIAAYLVLKIIPPPNPKSSITDQPQNNTHFDIAKIKSEGEQLLVPSEINDDKKLAIDEFKKGNYDQAKDKWKKSLGRSEELYFNDPEALIYKNNASAYSNNKTMNIIKIAVVVPITNKLGVAKQMLRGVAQAQNEVNEKGDGDNFSTKVVVVIIDDANDPATGKKVAEYLVKTGEITGVIGHNRSKVSEQTAPIYQANHLVMISPTSTSTKVGNIGNYIFRTVQSASQQAQIASDYIGKKKKVGVCFDSSDEASTSSKDAFVDLRRSELELANINCDMSRSNPNSFSPNQIFKEMKEAQVEALFVAANINDIDRAIETISATKGLFSVMISDSTLYDIDVLGKGDKVEGIRLVVPWAYSDTSTFAKEANKLWKTPNVNWRTATSYNAALVMIWGLSLNNNRESNNRESLQKALSNMKNSIKPPIGADQKIVFEGQNWGQDAVIVQMKKADGQGRSGKGYDFELGNDGNNKIK